MDSIYGSPVPDPADAPGVNLEKPRLPAPYTDVFGDPLHQMLDNLEMSILPQSPFPDIHEDSLSMALGKVENSIVRENPPLNPMALNDMLSELESKIEHQTVPAPKPTPELPSNIVLSEQEKLHRMPNGKSLPCAVLSETARKESTQARQFHEPTSRITGQYTGIRNNREIIWYCNRHSKRIMPDECDSCSDFEASEEANGNDAYCRHLYSRDAEEPSLDMEENTDEGESTDE